MHTIFINSKNKTYDLHRLLLIVSDKTNLKGSNKNVALSNLSMYYTWKNMKRSYKDNKFKIWNEKFKLPDESYSVSDTQNYFKYIIKKRETVTDN